MMRVLVLDDEISSQEVARRALQRAGISDVAFATDGASGLKILDRMEPKPALIICDIFMPEQDGIEIVHALVKRKFGGGLVLITGVDMDFLEVAKTISLQYGLRYLGSIQKPLRDEDLAAVLEALNKT